jgi:CRISPR/Cas system CSM-associated protein Csm2 small subunit
LVIQKGRLAQSSKTIDKSELSDWIQFGAQKILKASEGGTANEEDINRILEISDEKSKTIKDKVQTLEEKFNLQNFTNIPTSTVYEFEGKIFKRENNEEKNKLKDILLNTKVQRERKEV